MESTRSREEQERAGGRKARSETRDHETGFNSGPVSGPGPCEPCDPWVALEQSDVSCSHLVRQTQGD